MRNNQISRPLTFCITFLYDVNNLPQKWNFYPIISKRVAGACNHKSLMMNALQIGEK